MDKACVINSQVLAWENSIKIRTILFPKQLDRLADTDYFVRGIVTIMVELQPLSPVTSISYPVRCGTSNNVRCPRYSTQGHASTQ